MSFIRTATGGGKAQSPAAGLLRSVSPTQCCRCETAINSAGISIGVAAAAASAPLGIGALAPEAA